MVHYDPLQLSHADLQHAIAPLLQGLEAAEIAGRRWRIPACYDESLGLDLADVAQRTGLSVAQVVERHSQSGQLVYMMGFLPGLPYLGGLPPEFALPRRENPRVKVPRGSVAVAMAMTVVYPQESPGGWHILARTPAPLVGHAAHAAGTARGRRQGDVRAGVAARVRAAVGQGRRGRAAAGTRRAANARAARMTAALRVLAPGLMTTLQDLGRPGWQHLGVPVSGALDHVSLRAANLLVGNAAGVGALEIAYQGPTLRVEADSVRVAVAGGRAPIDILPPTARAVAAGASPPTRARVCCAGRCCGSARSRAARSRISPSRAVSTSPPCSAASRR